MVRKEEGVRKWKNSEETPIKFLVAQMSSP